MYKKIIFIFLISTLVVSTINFSGTGLSVSLAVASAASSPSDQANPFAVMDTVRKKTLSAASEKYVKNGISENTQSLNAKACALKSTDTAAKSFIVKFKKNITFEKIYGLLMNYDFEVIGGSTNRLFAVKANAIDTLTDALKGMFEYIEPDGTAKVQAAVNDPHFSDQWALEKTNIPSAWSITTGSKNVIVAMIDSGINRNHEDLANADIRQGWDYVSDKPVDTDVLGHGTETTGVIAATANNKIGIAGVCWNVEIVPFQVFASNGDADISKICEALYDAADMGADVINLSLGSLSYDTTEKAAVDYAVSKGCIIVASAGNDSSLYYTYPASYPGVISAASVNSSLTASDFSNYNGAVDVAAPGENILTTCADSNHSYAYVSGTSFSSPYVAGIAALARAYDDGIDSYKFHDILKYTSTDMGPAGYDSVYGYGLVDAGKVLSYLQSHSFVTFNSTGGSSVQTAAAENGSLISSPVVPSKSEYVFAGWYKESACINAWNFNSDKVTTDITLYAKWVANPGVPANVQASSASYSSIKVTWSAVSGAAGYEIYRSSSIFESYKLLSKTTAATFTNTALTTNKTYYYKVRAFKTVNQDIVYSNFSSSVSTKPVPSVPVSPKAVSNSYNSVKLTWVAVSGAAGYEVCLYNSSTGKCSLLVSTASASYINTSLKTNTAYSYKIRAFVTISGIKIYGGYTQPVSCKPLPSIPGSFTAARVNSTSIKLSWKAVTGASGYAIYKAASSAGTYSLVKTITSVSFTNTGLIKNKTYYYKIRAYTTVSGIKVYGAFTTIKSAKTY